MGAAPIRSFVTVTTGCSTPPAAPHASNCLPHPEHPYSSSGGRSRTTRHPSGHDVPLEHPMGPSATFRYYALQLGVKMSSAMRGVSSGPSAEGEEEPLG
ncbi:hypothetical protein NDU88_001520 [Pleurodeles waltl]|uniref:Uncharacterized protein n=1 Tax=Pleurodeles waltl TaxID=8319 RepID=A0AAV7TKC0_PLEWA|nr:hypothetical protein NDU88_001520 [Pleurodeles waltl]